ncbi:MAG: DUF6320 domain-containing protein [Angelakisella sp.]
MSLRCEKCNITVEGSHLLCPLCQAELSGQPQPENDRFPLLATVMQGHSTLIRILFFLSAVLVVLCFAANYLFYEQGFWSLLVAIGVVCMWGSMAIVLRKRHNIPKTILWQTIFYSVVALLLDLLTGWHRWSIDYAAPCFFIVAVLAMWAVAGILRLKLEDFLIYLMIDALIGVIPVVFILFNRVNVVKPTVHSVLASAISFIALVTFRDKALRSEFTRRLHI